MSEQLGDLSYVAIKRESTAGTFVIPDVFIDAYDASFETAMNLDKVKPLIGLKYKTYKTFRGFRSHQGEITFHADPNTMVRFMDMLLPKDTTTGGGPYTTPFLNTSAAVNTYTMEIAKGQVVERFAGVSASQITDGYDANVLKAKAALSALKSFTSRTTSNVSGTTITLATDYDDAPTAGLVTGDLIRFANPTTGATTASTTVASVTSGTVFEVASGSGITTGDLVYLRPQTVSISDQTPFLWTKTEYHFGATASAALAQTSAQQTRVEQGSSYTISHDLLPQEGAQRSGGFDPASLPRGQMDIEVKVKKFFDTVEEENKWFTNAKQALVIRQYGDTVSSTAMENRITLNDVRITEYKREVKPGEIIFAEITYQPTYDASDAQAFDVKVIHNISGF